MEQNMIDDVIETSESDDDVNNDRTNFRRSNYI